MCHWAWGQVEHPGTGTPTGWLNELGYHDFSGSGVVHLLGGTVALVGCIFIGPRRGRFSEDGCAQTIPGHSIPLTFIHNLVAIKN